MNGYVAITSSEWCENLKVNECRSAVFWRKRLSFKALEPGEYYFFFAKQKGKNKREIVGYALFQKASVVESKDAWSKYGIQLGSNSEEAFMNSIRSIYNDADVKLGCICLKEVTFFENPIKLDECGIVISPYTVSGKKITQEECLAILEKMKGR